MLALSDAEREEIERQDPTVREMVARAAAATPADIIALHGRVTLRDPATARDRESHRRRRSRRPGWPIRRAARRPRRSTASASAAAGKVVIRPAADADLHARMLDGRTATIERIFIDYDGRAHLGVTIDDDPGQELMRDTGRYLFFFAPEVEVVPS